MSDVWFTSDTHFSHENIIRYCNRPFANVAEMNEAMVKNWNARVKPDDVIYHLGDVALGKIADSLAIIRRLNGHKHLIPGNHDRCWPYHQKVRPTDVRIYQDVGFTIHAPQLYVYRVLLCHLPATGDSREEERYAEHRPLTRGGFPIVHGHVHDRWKVNNELDVPQVNVGVDVWDFRPVHLDEVRAIVGQ